MDAKKALLALVVVFLLFWLLTDPRGLAAAATDGGGWAWDLLTEIFRAIIRFLGAL